MLSDTAAARERTRGQDMVIKVIEVKADSDGVNVAYTGETMSLERAFQRGLIVDSDYAKVLDSQQTPQNAAEDVSQCEPVRDGEPCEVNNLLSKCLSGNKPPIELRNAHALRLSSPRLNTGDVNKCQDMEELNVDAAVQCDLMSSSSTLIVLGSQQQYLGLVLPPSEEAQIVPKSFVEDKLSASTEFTSSLVSKKEKILAFYIPQFSEVVDFDVAVQKGWIDSYTAERLKTVEIPDAVADDDHLHERFSSWLMYRKLTVDGCLHAADCLKVDRVPSPAEAEQLFISYLLINSYIDAQTGKRVVILDRELSKMVKVFLGEPISSEDGDKHTASLDLNVSSFSERAEKVYINEETNMETEDERHACEPPCFLSSVHGSVSFRVEAHAGDRAVNHRPVLDVTEDHDISVDGEDPHAAEKTAPLENTDWTKSDEFVEMVYGNDALDDDGGWGKSSRHTSHLNSESICRELDITESFEAELLQPEDLLDDEQDFVIEVLEEDISDLPSVGRAGMTAALSENLMDEEAFLMLLNSRSDDRGSTEGDEWDSMSGFREDVSGAHSSSYSAYFLSEKQTISRSGCTISISESFQAGFTEDEFVVSDPETSTSAQDDLPYTSRSSTLALTDAHGAEKRPAVRKVVAGGAAEDAEIGREIADGEVDYERGNVEEMSRCLHRCLPADDHRVPQMFSRPLRSRVTAERAGHAGESSLPTDRRDPQGVSNSRRTAAAGEGENPQTSDERANSESQAQDATFTAQPDSDGPLLVQKVLITESDSEVETQEVGERRSDAPPRVLADETSAAGAEMSALQTHLRHGPTASGGVGHRHIIIVSGSEDGTRVTSSPPTEGDSEEVSCVHQEADQRSPEAASSWDDIMGPDHVEGFSDGDSECEESGSVRTSPEADLVDQDRPGSQCSSADGELSAPLPPERQHGDRFRISSNSEEICSLKPPRASGGGVSAGEMSSERAEAAVRVDSECETPAESSGRAELASERVVKACSDELSDVRDPQSAEQVEDARSVLSNTPKPGEKSAHQTDTLQALLESRHPDLVVDLLKRNAHNLESKGEGEPQQEGKVSEKEEFPSVRQQLLHVLKTVTSSQDLPMLQEVMQSLNMALGNESPEVQRHLDSIKEESSEGEDEGSAEEDSPQSSATSDSCKVKQVEVC